MMSNKNINNQVMDSFEDNATWMDDLTSNLNVTEFRTLSEDSILITPGRMQSESYNTTSLLNPWQIINNMDVKAAAADEVEPYALQMKFLEVAREDNCSIQTLKEDLSRKRNQYYDDDMEEVKRYKYFKNIDDLKCIVDTASPGWYISLENFALIETACMINLLELVKEENKTPPGYQMSERYNGFRLIRCETDFGLSYLKKCITSLSPPWEGACIELKSLKDLPTHRKIRIYIPEIYIPKEDVIDLLIRSNPAIPIEKWNFIYLGKTYNGHKLLTFISDDENVKALESHDYSIRYAFRKLKVFVTKRVIHKVDEFENMEDEEAPEHFTDSNAGPELYGVSFADNTNNSDLDENDFIGEGFN